MNINQKYIDLHLLCCSGYGNVDYAYEDCKTIQRAIQQGFGVTLSIAECYNFWHWRSEQYEASFLSVGDSQGHVSDIQEWFVDWLKETDYTHSCELKGETMITCHNCNSSILKTKKVDYHSGFIFCESCGYSVGVSGLDFNKLFRASLTEEERDETIKYLVNFCNYEQRNRELFNYLMSLPKEEIRWMTEEKRLMYFKKFGFTENDLKRSR